MSSPYSFRPEPILSPGALAELQRRLARAGLDIPPQILSLDLPVPPRSRRQRIAAHVGQAGWRAGYTVAQLGRLLERTGDRIIDAGDWLAARVAGR